MWADLEIRRSESLEEMKSISMSSVTTAKMDASE